MADRVYTQTFGAVAALIVNDKDEVLLVKEAEMVGPTDAGKWNHPAGWLEVGEDPIEAVKREVLEETGHAFEPTHLLGVYSLVREDLKEEKGSVVHPVKLVFGGHVHEGERQALHDDVSEARWHRPGAIEAMTRDELRDIDIKRMVRDHFDGKRYPLELLTHTVQK